ncbi:nucleotide sugar dehydrogenase [soil metagenome]
MARISIFGIGYVGAVSAACLSQDGHDVTAVDTLDAKAKCINEGRSPIIEAGLDEIIAASVRKGTLRATTNAALAVATTDVSLVCVGTPSDSSGAIGTDYIKAVCREIGMALREKSSRHCVIIRSTIVPGTMDSLCIPILEEASGLTAFKDFGAGYYPEFLREGTAVADYYDPGLIVFGAGDAETEAVLREINANMPVPCQVVPLATAEAVKYASNCWRAVKVTFANEIGNVAKACGVDGQRVMELICMDTRVNISPAFMRPGFAFGGSCLPKDLRALQHLAGSKGVATPLLAGVLAGNELQISRAEAMVHSAAPRSVGMVGLSFKPGTDDVRESPLAELANRLILKGYGLKIYDPNVRAARRKQTEGYHDYVPGLTERLVDIEDLIADSDLILVGNRYSETLQQLDDASQQKPLIDLTRIDKTRRSDGRYEGICW